MTSFAIEDASMQQLTTRKRVAVLSDVSNKTDNSSQLLQEVIYLGMHA
jgi:hypothetical protein